MVVAGPRLLLTRTSRLARTSHSTPTLGLTLTTPSHDWQTAMSGEVNVWRLLGVSTSELLGTGRLGGLEDWRLGGLEA